MDKHTHRIVTTARKNIGRTQVEMCERTGLSMMTYLKIERGEDTNTSVRRLIEHELGWEHGSYDDILAGGDPTPAPPNLTSATTDQLLDELRRRLP